jgi:hypothetical protein
MIVVGYSGNANGHIPRSRAVNRPDPTMLERFASNQFWDILARISYPRSEVMVSDATRQRMMDAFKAALPTWADSEASAFNTVHGDIVSASVHRALPYGVTVKFVSANGSAFGPMLLTPVVVEQLLHLLQQEGFPS